jgi:hypothetical protein
VEASVSTGLASQDALNTGDRGAASLELSSGASVSVGARAVVRFDRRDGGEVVVLNRGRVELAVPHLPPGTSLAVRTPDTLVVVHGTKFSVDVVERGDALATTVDVVEGRVSVERAGETALLGPGGHWTSARSVAPHEQTHPVPGLAALEPPAPGAAKPLDQQTASPAQGSRNHLAEENRLFRAALAARRTGDSRRALALVTELVEGYPTSPLAPAAAREREELQRELSLQNEE